MGGCGFSSMMRLFSLYLWANPSNNYKKKRIKSFVYENHLDFRFYFLFIRLSFFKLAGIAWQLIHGWYITIFKHVKTMPFWWLIWKRRITDELEPRHFAKNFTLQSPSLWRGNNGRCHSTTLCLRSRLGRWRADSPKPVYSGRDTTLSNLYPPTNQPKRHLTRFTKTQHLSTQPQRVPATTHASAWGSQRHLPLNDPNPRIPDPDQRARNHSFFTSSSTSKYRNLILKSPYSLSSIHKNHCIISLRRERGSEALERETMGTSGSKNLDSGSHGGEEREENLDQAGGQLYVSLKMENYKLKGELIPHVYGSVPLVGSWDSSKAVFSRSICLSVCFLRLSYLHGLICLIVEYD